MITLTRRFDLPDLVAYAGATWDWHKLHYDPGYLASVGLEQPVVDGQAFGALLAEVLTGHLGPGWRLAALDFRFGSLVFAGETVRAEAVITAEDGERVTADLRVVVVDEDGTELRSAVSKGTAELVPPMTACAICGGTRLGARTRGWGAVTVAVVGAAECDLGVTGLSVLELQTQAITRALADAGLSLRDVDGLATNAVGRFPTTQVAEHLGLDLAWTESSFAGGSVFEMYVARAAQAIEAGQCSVVVISYASNQRSARARSLGATGDAGMPEAVYEAPYGPLYPASHYAMAAQRYLEVHGHDRAVLAEVAVAAREQALLNPAAYRYGAGPLTVDDVLGAAPVSDPLGVLDCCLVTDGGGAVVLTSLERARDLPEPPVVVLGYGEATTTVSMAGPDDLLATGAVASGLRAFGRAGLTPADVDVAQVYDSFTITVLLSLEGLGFAAPGEAPGLVGTLPLNTSGGGLSYCHPGQFGVLLLVEAVRQLRGTCGARQVAGAQVALAHGTGGILSTHATVLMGVDR